MIVTVFNEEKTLDRLLKALANQTYEPDEIVVVDGGSDDKTWQKLKVWQKKLKNLKVYYREGNRAIGRNLAIQKAKNNLIAITDAGCVPDKNWLEELIKTYLQTKAEVISGYYRGLAKTPLEEAIVPYVLVMPDKVDPKNFLPATRSMLITKKAWKKVGGFNELLDSSEDYDFALRLKQAGIKMAFAPDAVVGWLPRKTLVDFAAMILDFALWDVKAGHVRKKVKLLFLRYLIFFFFISMAIETKHTLWIVAVSLSILIYLVWSVIKNKKYVKKGWYWLPVLQIISDIMVMGGSMLGLMGRGS